MAVTKLDTNVLVRYIAQDDPVHSNPHFADCLIERSAHRANCAHMMTFDEKAAKTAGMRLLS